MSLIIANQRPASQKLFVSTDYKQIFFLHELLSFWKLQINLRFLFHANVEVLDLFELVKCVKIIARRNYLMLVKVAHNNITT